jgi:hypothetical protein
VDWKDLFGKGFGAQAFGGIGYEAVWAQLKPWLGNVTTNGVLKWLPKAASRLPCQVPEYENGVPRGACAFVALEACLACGRPVCLNHAFVDAQGDAICYLCAVGLREGGGAAHARPEPPPPGKDERAAQEKAQALAQAWWARGVLGLAEGAAWDAVKSQHRKLSAQYHPDRAGGDEKRFKDVQKAYDILTKAYGEN